MAHFAELDADGRVLRVIVVNNDVIEGKEFPESEGLGAAFCIQLFGPSDWRQTSYTGAFRRNFAAVGSIYDSVRDIFIAPQPYPSWVLDVDTAEWCAPKPHPEEGRYLWNEEQQDWCAVEEPDYEVE